MAWSRNTDKVSVWVSLQDREGSWMNVCHFSHCSQRSYSPLNFFSILTSWEIQAWHAHASRITTHRRFMDGAKLNTHVGCLITCARVEYVTGLKQPVYLLADFDILNRDGSVKMKQKGCLVNAEAGRVTNSCLQEFSAAASRYLQQVDEHATDAHRAFRMSALLWHVFSCTNVQQLANCDTTVQQHTEENSSFVQCHAWVLLMQENCAFVLSLV